MYLTKFLHVTGILSWYDKTGYIVPLKLDQTTSRTTLNTLQSEEWLNRETAAVFTELSLYSPNTNTFVDVKYLVEFPLFSYPQTTVVITPLHVLFR